MYMCFQIDKPLFWTAQENCKVDIFEVWYTIEVNWLLLSSKPVACSYRWVEVQSCNRYTQSTTLDSQALVVSPQVRTASWLTALQSFAPVPARDSRYHTHRYISRPCTRPEEISVLVRTVRLSLCPDTSFRTRRVRNMSAHVYTSSSSLHPCKRPNGLRCAAQIWPGTDTSHLDLEYEGASECHWNMHQALILDFDLEFAFGSVLVFWTWNILVRSLSIMWLKLNSLTLISTLTLKCWSEN